MKMSSRIERCHICRGVMESDKTVFFPAIVANELDQLWGFNDRSFHRTCLEKDVVGRKALREVERYSDYLATYRPGNYVCRLCGKRIEHPDDMLSTGVLSSEETDPLYSLNHLQVHRNCLKGNMLEILHSALDKGILKNDRFKKLLPEREKS